MQRREECEAMKGKMRGEEGIGEIIQKRHQYMRSRMFGYAFRSSIGPITSEYIFLQGCTYRSENEGCTSSKGHIDSSSLFTKSIKHYQHAIEEWQIPIADTTGQRSQMYFKHTSRTCFAVTSQRQVRGIYEEKSQKSNKTVLTLVSFQPDHVSTEITYRILRTQKQYFTILYITN